MAVYLSAQEKADIFKEACSENCLIHVQNYFGTRNGLVDLERYRAHNWEAIYEDGVIGIGPREKVDEVFNYMERHIDEVYKHLHSDPQSVSAHTKFAFNIVTPEALRYSVCKVLKVSYGAAKFIVIFGYRESISPKHEHAKACMFL
ncbi:hypothetical protein DAPPUDRAFT_104533 [Daphnia pulex]|uniref:Uncharacterized protein n=1 Tax=Daphnia pulex TaxID=6669 RepID=E9GMJ2_DAPPU|nr:hypothetical protein DAPPUDRAFT_104533 [Daphnia pulex]|eukprot:EFX79378.1 hypothetical protein DAPPUDRAFT_104533 [Daphnia pulex]